MSDVVDFKQATRRTDDLRHERWLMFVALDIFGELRRSKVLDLSREEAHRIDSVAVVLTNRLGR